MFDQISARSTRADTRRTLEARFRAAGLEDSAREATLTLTAAARLRAVDLVTHPDAPLGDRAGDVEAFTIRRERGEPLSRILGRRAFWSLDLTVTPDVLDPRADTETIVEAALEEFARTAPLRIVDFGTGSGAILAALLTEFPNATGLGVDRSEKAAEVARENMAMLSLANRAEIRVADWGDGVEGAYDLIVSNPPYIPSEVIPTLDREVREHDPRPALDGGPDGLDAYRALAPHITRLLAKDGRFAVEHGMGQGADVANIFDRGGLRVLKTRRDLGGVERVAVGAW